MPKVMIVDDDESLRKLYKRMFESEGFDIVTAESGSECLYLVQKEIPDFILLDIMMPKMDGIAVFKKLLSDKKTAGIPVGLYSSLDRDILNYVGEDAGVVEKAVAFWVKGKHDPSEMVDAIKKSIYTKQE